VARMEDLLKVLDRINTGPICTANDWDMKIIPGTVREKLKKYDLNNLCTPDDPINSDDELADRFYKAGRELALELGMLCVDTERRIMVSEEELDRSLRFIPKELRLGYGQDEVVMISRKPEDPRPPLFKSPLGIVATEDVWIPLMQGIAQNKEIDVLQGATLETVFGLPIRSGTPSETFAGRLNAKLSNEVIWRAGRAGMPVDSVMTSPTSFGQLGGYGSPGGSDPGKDPAVVLAPSELKTTYNCLHKVVQAVGCGGPIYSGTLFMIGGYAGSPEGTTLVTIAYGLLHYFVHQATYGLGSPYDVRYLGNSGRHALWTCSMALQALSRNVETLRNTSLNVTAGPGTEMILLESAMLAMDLSVSGVSIGLGPRSGAGQRTNYLSPLECKFSAEVIKACAGMTRKQANEIAKIILPRYENMLGTPPKGLTFQECYDVKKIEPTKEWLNIYLRVKKELIDLGIPLAPGW
jgi:methylamine--corrinoid protein Co-methyltransferase